MAISGIFFNTTLFVDDLYFDTHTQEDHLYSTRLTRKPVEFGANITDNIFVQPVVVKCNVLLSDSQTLVSFARGLSDSPFDLINRKADGLLRLRQLQATRQPFRLITGLASYEDMFLVEIDAGITKESQTTLSASLTFEQVIIVGDSNVFNNNTAEHS